MVLEKRLSLLLKLIQGERKGSMRILICGGTGQLGQDCHRVFRKNHSVYALGRGDLDITDRTIVEKTIKELAPEVVINCAAYTNVDASENNPDLAFQVNTLGAENLARSCSMAEALMVHISTDYVFDGKFELPWAYEETYPTSPLGVYGKTKLEGEQRVARFAERHIIVRSAWLYGIHGGNFVKTMLKLALNNPDGTIRVVNDQFGSPTWTLRLALQLECLVKAQGHGLFHASAEGYCSWYEFAVYFLKKMGVRHNIVPCTSEEYPTPAPRPHNSILDNARLKRNAINRMTGWRHGVDLFVSRFRQELLEECSSLPDTTKHETP
jgi:dTDP-4-dehydrorhamnose reductase